MRGKYMKKNKDFENLPKRPAKKKKEEQKEKHLTRLIKLLITLDNGVLNLNKAAQEYGVDKRTILRDVRLLQDSGVPLYKPNEQNANYRLQEDFYLPHFRVTEENALQFADFVDMVLKTLEKPAKLVLPIQEGVLAHGRKAQEKRAAKKTDWEMQDATDEDFYAGFLISDEMDLCPHPVMLLLTEVGKYFDQTGKNRFCQDRQLKLLRRELVRLQWLTHQYPEALKTCKSLIERYPKEAWGYRMAALICYTDRNLPAALKYTADGLAKKPDDVRLNLFRAHFLVQAKQYEQALACFNHIYKHKGHQAQYAAWVYISAGQFDKALLVVEKAQKEDPENTSFYQKIREHILAEKNKKNKSK